MRFGYHTARYQAPDGRVAGIYPALRASAVWAEDAGFDYVTLTDHVRQFPSVGPEDDALLEPWLTLAALAGATRRVTLGTLVTNVGLRNPALLAKMAATLDAVSGGRAMMGLGAGAYAPEYMSFGYAPVGPKEGAARLSEAVRLMRALWAEPVSTFRGTYYQTRGAVLEPKPRHQPRVLIGGGGERHTLRAVAEVAEACNLVSPGPEALKRKLAVLYRHCHNVGRDPRSIEVTVLEQVVLAPTVGAARAKGAALLPGNGTGRSIVGTPDDARAALHAYAAAGLGTLFVFFPVGDTESRELFARLVMPDLREPTR